MLAEVSNKMRDAISHLKVELAQIRTGRASGTLVSDIQVDAYNSKMMVKELAQITTPEPTVILISPWDKSIITNIVGGIAKADIGLNSVVDGDIIRIAIPPLTSERRDQFIEAIEVAGKAKEAELRQV